MVYEALKALTEISSLNIIQESVQITQLKNILPLILHPNTWIRGEVLNYLHTLIKALNTSQIYCFIKPLLKPYLNENILLIEPGHFEQFLIPPLSRIIFDFERWRHHYEISLTETDFAARKILVEGGIVEKIRSCDLNYNNEAQKLYDKEGRDYALALDTAKRVEPLNILDMLPNMQFLAQKKGGVEKDLMDLENTDDFIEQYYYPYAYTQGLSALDSFTSTNLGLNPQPIFETKPNMNISYKEYYKYYKVHWIHKALNFSLSQQTIELGDTVIIYVYIYIYI